MALAQWTVDQLWKQVQWIAGQGRTQKAQLEAQRLELQRAYSAARAGNATETMAALEPLIHRNSELRVRWNEMRGQFNTIVEKARSFLAEYGIKEPPTLAGLGFLPAAAVAPALYVAALVAVIAIIYEITEGIKAVNEGIRRLGPVGSTALAIVPLAIAALFLMPYLKRRAA